MRLCEYMPDNEYFALDAIDQTMLKRFMTSPLEYAYLKQHGQGEQAQFQFGKAAHSLILERGPHVAKAPDRRTKKGKETLAELEEEYGDDIVYLNTSDYERVHEMKQRMPSMQSFADGEAEIAMVCEDPETGLLLKGKADWLPSKTDGGLRIIDYKTVSLSSKQLASPNGFSREAYTYGYHIQAAFYMNLYRLVKDYKGPMGFRFIVQSKQPPYDWVVRDLAWESEEVQSIALPRIRRALDQLAWWRDNTEESDRLQQMSKWGVDKTPQTIHFTPWQLETEREEIESWE